MEIYCGKCNEKLTAARLVHADAAKIRREDQEQLLDDGQFLTADEFEFSFGVPVTHFVGTNSLLLNDHEDVLRHQGCCGPGMTNKYNKVCWNCKYEIGIIFADCYGPHFVAINSDRLNTTRHHEPNP